MEPWALPPVPRMNPRRRFPMGRLLIEDTFEISHVRLILATDCMLSFAAGVVAAPNPDGAWDEPDCFEQHVATITCRIAHLALPLPMLASIASGLEQAANGRWGRLADELRRDYPDLSDLHFAAVILATLEAIRDVALTIAARNHVDSCARLKLFAMGLGVASADREKVRALVLHDIDVLLNYGREHP
jgi:hypothetical protein